MAQPYVGEIRIFAGNFAPSGWMLCQGQLLPISEFETLFNLIGTTYGGDGQSTFALPNLQSRFPMHFGNGFTLAETGGSETVILTTNQIPAHNHVLVGSNAGDQVSPENSVFSTDPGGNTAAYNNVVTSGGKAAASLLTNSGGSQPHDNMQPFLALNFIISLFGIFPSQT